MNTSTFSELLGIALPIVQAPMAGGHTTPKLVSPVSNAGALGGYGAAVLPPETIQRDIQEIRSLTDKPFLVNLFLLDEVQADPAQIERTQQALAPLRNTLGIPTPPVPERYCEDNQAQIHATLEMAPPAVSFTFGIPEASILQQFKKAGTIVIGTATTVREAVAWEQAGADAICLQGIEAGGHRGTFLQMEEAIDIGIMTLVSSATHTVKIPCIAAGGIMDGHAISAVMQLGAQGVQMGTAFLTCEESGTPAHWQQALINAGPDSTECTRAFSGRRARGLTNAFARQFRDRSDVIAPYPVHNVLTKDIRRAAAAQNNAEYFSYWAGQGVDRVRPMSVQQLLTTLKQEMESGR